MSVETMSRRISVIEQTWKDATVVGRAGYVDELSEISTGLGHITGPEAERVGTLLDVSRPGNGNAGHIYGTALSPGEKRALVEYLKTR